jgi:hypothetical protein
MRLDTLAQIVARCPVRPGPTQDVTLKPPLAALKIAIPAEPPNPHSVLPEERSRVRTTRGDPMVSLADLLFPSLCPSLTQVNPPTAPTAHHDFPVILVHHLRPPFTPHLHRLSLIPILIRRERRSLRTEHQRPRFPPTLSAIHWWTNLCYNHQ